MADFQLKARVQFTPRSNLGQFIATKITPATIAATTEVTQKMFDRTQELVAVDTGELKASGHVDITPVNNTVVGKIAYDAPYASYVEYGTGRRGAESADAGPFPYNADWPGMAPQPYIRPAADETRETILSDFAASMSVSLKST